MDTLREKNMLQKLWDENKAHMENLVMDLGFWRDKRVMITGHTGFKGGWLSLWMHGLGAKVHGFSLEPKVENEFYNKVYSGGFIGIEQFSDVADLVAISKYIEMYQPEVIFHLAAQPLVRTSCRKSC